MSLTYFGYLEADYAVFPYALDNAVYVMGSQVDFQIKGLVDLSSQAESFIRTARAVGSQIEGLITDQSGEFNSQLDQAILDSADLSVSLEQKVISLSSLPTEVNAIIFKTNSLDSQHDQNILKETSQNAQLETFLNKSLDLSSQLEAFIAQASSDISSQVSRQIENLSTNLSTQIEERIDLAQSLIESQLQQTISLKESSLNSEAQQKIDKSLDKISSQVDRRIELKAKEILGQVEQLIDPPTPTTRTLLSEVEREIPETVRLPGTITLKQFESKDFLPLSTRSANIYEQKISIVGNSLLSTVYVESLSAGCSILVEYIDTTTSNAFGSEILLQKHSFLTTPGTHQITVTGFNDKPFIRAYVINGVARFSIYGTVKGMGETDANMTRHNALAVIENHKGLLISGYDSEEQRFRFLPMTNDAVKVSGDIEVQAPDGLDVYPNGLRNGGRISVVNLNANTWTALPASPLAKRNAMSIQNLSGQPIKINYNSSIGGFVGITLGDQSERSYNITDGITLFAKCASGTAQVIVEELS